MQSLKQVSPAVSGPGLETTLPVPDPAKSIARDSLGSAAWACTMATGRSIAPNNRTMAIPNKSRLGSFGCHMVLVGAPSRSGVRLGGRLHSIAVENNTATIR